MKNYAEYPAEVAADFIEQWEGCRLEAYQCSAGVWTIGVGHTEGVKEGDVITYAESRAFLSEDIRKRVEALAPDIKVPVSEGQFVALTSLAFNVGVASVSGSQLVKKLNAVDIPGAADEFLDGWDTAGGKVVPGLQRRRRAERKLFLGE